MTEGRHTIPLSELSPQLNNLIAPQAGDIITVTGVSGVGKTDFLLDLALATTDRSGPVDFFSFAHPVSRLQHRLARKLQTIAEGDCKNDTNSKWAAMANALPICFHDQHDMDISFIEANSTADRTVFIDGFNYLEDFSHERGRVEEITALCRRLKRLARRINAPIIQTAMLSNYDKTRSSYGIPFKNASIKESAYIGDFSDQVIYLHREFLFLESERPADTDLDAMANWQDAMEEHHTVAQAFTFRDHWLIEEMRYSANGGWGFHIHQWLNTFL